MADRFGVDAQAAAQTARDLAAIRATFNGLKDTFAQDAAVTGSAKVQAALRDFSDHSSDARKKLDQELERAAGLLAGLARGATTLDASLADAVTIKNPPVSTTVPVQPGTTP